MSRCREKGRITHIGVKLLVVTKKELPERGYPRAGRGRVIHSDLDTPKALLFLGDCQGMCSGVKSGLEGSSQDLSP